MDYTREKLDWLWLQARYADTTVEASMRMGLDPVHAIGLLCQEKRELQARLEALQEIAPRVVETSNGPHIWRAPSSAVHAYAKEYKEKQP